MHVYRLRPGQNRRGFGILGCIGVVALIIVALIIAAAIAGYFYFTTYFQPYLKAMVDTNVIAERFIDHLDNADYEGMQKDLTAKAQETWTPERLEQLKSELDENVGNYRQSIPVPMNPSRIGTVKGGPNEVKRVVGADYKKGVVRYDLEFVRSGDDWKINGISYKLLPGKKLVEEAKDDDSDSAWNDLMAEEFMGDVVPSIPPKKDQATEGAEKDEPTASPAEAPSEESKEAPHEETPVEKEEKP